MAKESTKTASKSQGAQANSSQAIFDFSKLAGELIKQWSSTPSWSQRGEEDGFAIDESKLVAALELLVQVGGIGGIDINKLKAAVSLADQIGLVEDAVMLFQKARKLEAKDGILGIRTWKALKGLRSCPQPDPTRIKELSDTSTAKLFNSRRAKGFIFYHIDSSMPAKIQDVSTSRLITDAWNLWQQHADFNIVLESRADNANVIVNMRSLGDGVGGTLGIAHVGGPTISQQLECSMDADENWTPDKFRVAICHEFGHILGLTHDQTAGQLMSPFLDDRISIPQWNDIARIQAKWGAREDAGPVRPDPEDEGLMLG